uniref:Uncharacterized protein n=1 Tax=Arundo donax TaxID=35708 RepID=A0A0A8ZU71_ARUDO
MMMRTYIRSKKIMKLFQHTPMQFFFVHQNTMFLRITKCYAQKNFGWTSIVLTDEKLGTGDFERETLVHEQMGAALHQDLGMVKATSGKTNRCPGKRIRWRSGCWAQLGGGGRRLRCRGRPLYQSPSSSDPATTPCPCSRSG